MMKPFPDGGSAGLVPPSEEMLDAYYETREWDKETGKPTPLKMQELWLSEYVDDIWK